MAIARPDRAQERLLAYLYHARRHPGVQAARPSSSLDDIAAGAGLGREPCRAALYALAEASAVRVYFHAAAAVEVRIEVDWPSRPRGRSSRP